MVFIPSVNDTIDEMINFFRNAHEDTPALEHDEDLVMVGIIINIVSMFLSFHNFLDKVQYGNNFYVVLTTLKGLFGKTKSRLRQENPLYRA